VITVENMSFSTILKQVSFHLPAGKTLAVIGHNGAGKTTLFHVLLGFKFATEGGVKIEASRWGYVPERPYLSSDETLESFLKLHQRLISNQGEASELIRVATLVGLEKKLKEKFKNFSKGMLQKALIAQALLQKPQLVIFDEPMSGLDPETREEIKNQLKELKNQGVSFIFSSHVMEDVAQLADFVLELEQGKMKRFEEVKR